MNGGEEGDTLPSSKSIKRNATTTRTNQQKTANAQLTAEKGTEPIAVRTEKPSNNATTMSVFISLHYRSNTTWTLGSRGYCMRVFVGFPLLRPSPKSQRHTSHTPCTGRVQKRDTRTHTSAPHFDRPTARPDPTCKARIQMHRHTRAPALPTPRDTNYAFN